MGCHKGGYLSGGANLLYIVAGGTDKNMVDWAINICKSMSRCTGFTRLGNEFWFKHDRHHVYGKGSHAKGKYWESYMKCGAYSNSPHLGRRELADGPSPTEVPNSTGTYKSMPFSDLKEALEQTSSGIDVIPPFDTPEAPSKDITPSETLTVLSPAEEESPDNSAAYAILEKDAEEDVAWLQSHSEDRRSLLGALKKMLQRRKV